MIATRPTQLSQDLDALIAMDDEGVDVGEIARLLHRDVDWCERQLKLKRQADERMRAQAAAKARLKADRTARFQAAAARGREKVLANRKAQKRTGHGE